MHFVGFGFQPVEKSPDTVVAGRAVDDPILLSLFQLLKRDIRGDFVSPAKAEKILKFETMVIPISPGFDRPLLDGQLRIRYDQIQINIDGSSKTSASFTGSQRAVERKQVR